MIHRSIDKQGEGKKEREKKRWIARETESVRHLVIPRQIQRWRERELSFCICRNQPVQTFLHTIVGNQ